MNPNPKVRRWAYIFTAIGTPVVAYLQVKGYIGDAESVLWAAEVTVVNGMAAVNTQTA